MIRARFKANLEDPRPIKWPILHPYWVTGAGEDYATLVSYGTDIDYIKNLWPEAFDIDIEEVEGYSFSDRFQCPKWFKEG